jgi:hypothetical protein
MREPHKQDQDKTDPPNNDPETADGTAGSYYYDDSTNYETYRDDGDEQAASSDVDENDS